MMEEDALKVYVLQFSLSLSQKPSPHFLPIFKM